MLTIESIEQEPEVEILRLRPHHLLCIPNFEGKGYSESFICNLRKIKERIENEKIHIRIVEGQDDVCTKCPNRDPCKLMKYPLLLDKRTRCVLGIEYGKVYDASTLLFMVKKRISVELMHMLCKDCAFYPHCKGLFEKHFLHESEINSI